MLTFMNLPGGRSWGEGLHEESPVKELVLSSRIHLVIDSNNCQVNLEGQF